MPQPVLDLFATSLVLGLSAAVAIYRLGMAHGALLADRDRDNDEETFELTE